MPAPAESDHGGITPFRIEVPDAVLQDLRDRLARTRWVERETVDDWSQGVPLGYLQELCEYWRLNYDWRRAEASLNAVPQFRTKIDGLGIHFMHTRSPHQDAMPLLLLNGWPGSMTEYLKVIGPLTDPPSYGGDAADAFHVVCPVMPGFGFSDKPTATGWGVWRIAAAWAELMTRLGYSRYGAHGSDWGARVCTDLARQDSGNLTGIHLASVGVSPEGLASLGELTDDENRIVEDGANYQRWDSGYAVQQASRPQTLGYGLVDSPVAQCAWIIEKFWAWTDCAGHPENALTRDELLDNVTLYWATQSGGSSGRLYWENFHDRDFTPITVPTGVSILPRDVIRPSRRLAEQRFRDIRRWTEHDRGGHFPAIEQPEAFVDEVRAFFGLVR